MCSKRQVLNAHHLTQLFNWKLITLDSSAIKLHLNMMSKKLGY